MMPTSGLLNLINDEALFHFFDTCHIFSIDSSNRHVKYAFKSSELVNNSSLFVILCNQDSINALQPTSVSEGRPYRND